MTKKVSGGDLVAGVCGLLLLLTPFLKLWGEYSWEAETGRVRASLLQGDAYPGMLAWCVVVGGLASVLLMIIRTTEGVPQDPSRTYLGLGGLMFVALVIMAIRGPNEPERLLEFEELRLLIPGIEIEVKRGVMMFIGPVLAAGVAFGGFMMRPPKTRLALGVQMPGRGLDA